MALAMKLVYGQWMNPDNIACLTKGFAPNGGVEGCFIHFGMNDEKKALYIHGQTCAQVAVEINT